MSPVAPFADRREAGRALAGRLERFAGRSDVVVLGLPRGGVPVAFEVARALGAPLDAYVVRKLGAPGRPELAMGAIGPGGTQVMNEDVLDALEIDAAAVQATVAAELRELERREAAYRGGRPAVRVAERTAVVVDDGLATGASMRAAVAALRVQHARAIVVAVPVASADVCAAFAATVDAVECARTPRPFHAVGFWYDDFSPTTDDEVRALLALAGGRDRP